MDLGPKTEPKATTFRGFWGNVFLKYMNYNTFRSSEANIIIRSTPDETNEENIPFDDKCKTFRGGTERRRGKTAFLPRRRGNPGKS